MSTDEDVPAATPTGSPSTFAAGPLSGSPATEPEPEGNASVDAPTEVPGGLAQRVKKLFSRG